jgi:peptidyl-prolyl cis-trans isomerase SurA
MITHRNLRRFPAGRGLWLAALIAWAGAAGYAQSASPPAKPAAPVVLDRVVAVVNDHAILASDLKEEMLLSVLEPNDADRGAETPELALQRLISRSLIRQQIREEDAQTTAPTSAEVDARMEEIRRQLPVCVREHCATDDGWDAFLDRHGLTQERVKAYLRNRLQILRFIEIRFRQGIRISDQEVATYYRDTLLPQYPAGQAAPPLAEVSPRIEEILLQQRVNAMFNDWLDNLRQQGEVEVLDPSLVAAAKPDHGGAAAQ